jgi:hypothetical protein
MLYKLFGFLVWRLIVGYLRYRFRGLGRGRRLLLAGGLVATLLALAGAGRRASGSGQLTP